MLDDATLSPLESAEATIAQLRSFILEFAQAQHLAHHRKQGVRFAECPMVACSNVRTLLERTSQHAPLPPSQPPAAAPQTRMVLALARDMPTAGPVEAVLVPVPNMSRAKAMIPRYLKRGWQHAWPIVLLGPGKS